MLFLDVSLDITTFRLEGFGFRDRSYTIPRNLAAYQDDIDLGEQVENVRVDVVGGVDTRMRRVFLTLEAVDPATGHAPDNLSAGVVPPNPENGTVGQGYFSFRVRVLRDTPRGTRVGARASIFFDDEAPVITPEIFNTIDHGPATSVQVLSKPSAPHT